MLGLLGSLLENGGGGGSAAWGDITGTLSDQTDLQSALDAKQDQDNLLDSISGLGGNGVIRRVDANTAESVSDAEVVEDAINGATAKTSLVDADLFGIIDSAASNVLKKITWANIKAALLAIFIPRTQTVTVTASRDLALTDACNLLDCTSSSAVVLTVRLNATVAMPVGVTVNLYQSGTGVFSVAAEGGVTIQYAEGLKIAARYKAASLYQKSTDVWIFVGAIAA